MPSADMGNRLAMAPNWAAVINAWNAAFPTTTLPDLMALHSRYFNAGFQRALAVGFPTATNGCTAVARAIYAEMQRA